MSNWFGFNFSATATLAFALVLPPILSGCSNPFSGSKEARPVDTFHTKNVQCNQLDLSANRMTAPLLRSIVQCLNTNNEIEAMNALISQMSDQDLQPLIQWIDQKGIKSPQTFYSIRELIFRLEKDGRFKGALSEVQSLLTDPEKNQKFAKIASKLDLPITDLLNGDDFKLNGQSVYVLTSSQAYLRLINEHQDPAFLKNLIYSTKKFLSEADANSLESLFLMLSNNRVDAALRTLTAKNSALKIRRLSSFFSWMFKSNRYSTLTTSLRAIQDTKSLSCLKGATQIKHPLNTALHELAGMNAQEAREYLGHDLYNMSLFAKGYCDVPYQLDPLVKFIRDAAEQPGFDEMFALIKPLMEDERFITFITSHASENWVRDNAHLAQGNFFQDLFTLLLLNNDYSITSNGQPVAHFLDNAFQTLSADETLQLLRYLGPWMNPEHGFGNKMAKLWFEIQEEVSSEFDSTTFNSERARAKVNPLDFKPLLHSTFRSNQLGNVLNLGFNLLSKNKIEPLINESLHFFQSYLDRGVHALQFKSAVYPKFSQKHPYFWQLKPYVFTKKEKALELSGGCALTLDWDFTHYSNSSSANERTLYRKQMDTLLKCVNPNQTFQNAYDLYLYASQSNEYTYILGLQKDLLSGAIGLDLPLTLNTVKTFLKLRPEQTKSIPQVLDVTSRVVKLINLPDFSFPVIKAWISEQIKLPAFFSGLKVIAEKETLTSNRHAPALDLLRLNRMDAFISQDLFLNAVNLTDAMGAYVQEYCPSLNPSDHSCALDDDQVATYRRSVPELIAQIKKEYLSSVQNHLDPKEFKKWEVPTNQPTNVSNVSYHLNPIYQEFYQHPAIIHGLFDGVNRIQSDHYDLGKFLQTRALKLTMIPYYYQTGKFPVGGGKQYHDRIRIRIVSELDRLELVAINADFKGFGLLKNFGLGFIRDIGLSWGDEPEANWPKDLGNFVSLNNVKTLSETRYSIHKQLATFDTGLIQKLGSCNPRGRSGVGAWIATHLCNSELSDISARLFNLRSLVSLIDQELPTKDGGRGGLMILRDIFYHLYATTPKASRDRFPNGMKLNARCVMNPVSVADFVSAHAPENSEDSDSCEFDHLALISKITHLGMLHNVGLAYLKDRSIPVVDTVSILNKLTSNAKLENRVAKLFSSRGGLVYVQDGIDIGFNSTRTLSDSIMPALSTANSLNSVEWLNFFLDLIEKDPHLVHAYAPLIERIFSQSTSLVENIASKMKRSAELRSWAEQSLTHYQPKLATEVLPYLNGLKKSVPEFVNLWDEAEDISAPDLEPLRASGVQWFQELALDRAAPTRQKLSQWVDAGGISDVRDVLSDSKFIGKTYKFLDSINQNSDSLEFIDRCQDFLLRP